MKANELRIGNYVNHDRVINKIESIFNTFEMVDIETLQRNILHVNLEFIKPIPLTEQWLIDFGFKKSKKQLFDLTIFRKGKYFVSMSKNINIFGCKESAGTKYEPIRKLKYIHELQNLYFALTGEELTKTSKSSNAEK